MSKLSELVQGVLNIDPSADAIEFEGSWWTWGDLSKIGAAVDAALSGAGLEARARVGCILRNRPETAATLLALIASDRCVVTLNPSLPDDRLASAGWVGIDAPFGWPLGMVSATLPDAAKNSSAVNSAPPKAKARMNRSFAAE